MKIIFNVKNYSLYDTLTCGQCFRFNPDENNTFSGVMGKYLLTLSQCGDQVEVEGNFPETEEENIGHYFSLTDDYSVINRILSQDVTLARMIDYCGNIRIMNQDFWETLASFVISQNNNIPRIAGIIQRLCSAFGEDEGGYYSFPTAERLASLAEEDLSVLRCGYRAPYLIDAARKNLDGMVTEDKLLQLGLEDARKLLMKINGVGPKVADCALLFGAHRLDAFPKDVWIKKAMAFYFPDGLPEFAVPYAGIAQQYIFHYARHMGFNNQTEKETL